MSPAPRDTDTPTPAAPAPQEDASVATARAKPLRVLHVCDKLGTRGSTIHGVTRLFSWWLPRFDKTRHMVDLVVLRPWDHSADFLVGHGVQVRCLSVGKFDPRTIFTLLGMIRRGQYDLVHLHGYSASNFGRIAAKMAGVPAIIHEHFVDPAMPAYQKVADRLLASASTKGVGVSRSVAGFLSEGRYIAPERIEFVPNGAPLADFRPVGEAEAAEARAGLGIPADADVIGAIGRIDRQKGLVHLIRALPHLEKKGFRPWVVLVGDGPERGKIESEAAALGVSDRLVMPGFSTDARAWQTNFTIQAFPSLWEGTPLSLFEAMSMRRPIVASAVDGLAETLVDGETGLLVPKEDPEALAAALADLLGDPEKAARLGAAAEEASRDYDIDVAVKDLSRIYDELAPRARS